MPSSYDSVKAIGMELCPALGISIPVGKDSLSMATEPGKMVIAAKKVVLSSLLGYFGILQVSSGCSQNKQRLCKT